MEISNDEVRTSGELTTCAQTGEGSEIGNEGRTAAGSAVTRRGFLGAAGATLITLAYPLAAQTLAPPRRGGSPLTVLPEDGRKLYLDAIDSATEEIRILICVLEDPQILERVQAALHRGVSVRAIVDSGKYHDLAAERDHLQKYLTSQGGELHLSNPVFPRSFPKIILIDSNLLVYGSACLDQTTFLLYRDFATTSEDPQLLQDLHLLFENDWSYSAGVGEQPPAFNPTPPFSSKDLIISPVNGAEKLVHLYQTAQQSIEVYTEILGNLMLESELAAAVRRGVEVRTISPFYVNGGSPEVQARQLASLRALSAAGVDAHVNGSVTPPMPYMHARADVVDGRVGFLGSVSVSPDSVAFNREMGLVVRDQALVQQLRSQFESDFQLLTRKFAW